MTISQINNVHLKDTVQDQEREGLSSSSKEENEKKAPGLTLQQVFCQDIIDNFPIIEILSHTVELEAKTPSLWGKIFSWWYQPDIKAQTLVAPTSEVDLMEVDEVEPISPVPALDEPDSIPADLAAAKLPAASKKAAEKNKLSQSELIEGLSLMSKHTIEQIMFIILKAQTELEKENANIAEGTFSKFQDFKKLQQKILEEIKDVLANDEKIAGRFNTAKSIAVAATSICAFAGAVVTCGTLFPLIIPAALVAFAGPFAAVGMPMTAGCTALISGSNIYFKRRADEDRAKHTQLNHQDKYYTDRLDDSRERLIATAEADNVFKERWINLIKRFHKMSQLVSQK